ncbi:hypothetical protein B7463_g3162, partial [Scytalidium lignicola]
MDGQSKTTFHGETNGYEVVETLPDDSVFIAGGGPVGLTLATSLSYFGIKSVVLERNKSTTRWPKMDLTNARSMEFFRRLGLADSLREQGVPSHLPYTVRMCSGLGGHTISQWDLPGVDQWRKIISEQNDGTQPLESWQRLSQIVFEKWLKEICDKNPLVDLRFGWKVESAEETDEGVLATATAKSGKKHVFKARYGVACDGASSRVRCSLGIPLIGGPVQGGHVDNAYSLAPDVDSDKMGSEESVYQTVGGNGKPFKIGIDEVLVRSTYRANLVVARHFMGPKRRIFLAGDAAYQNIPVGGYGMNMGLADAFNIAAKLAGVMQGYGGRHLLESDNGKYLDDDSDQGREIRRKIHEHYQKYDGENKDIGIEMGYTYESSVILPEDPSTAPEFIPRKYVLSTWPGHRALHVFLTDGTPIFDLYGTHYSLVDFTGGADNGLDLLLVAAEERAVPLKHIGLKGETKAREIWERDLVLVRPDGHVSWRGNSISSKSDAVNIIEVAVGIKGNGYGLPVDTDDISDLKPFTGTEKLEVQYPDFKLEKKGAFQK